MEPFKQAAFGADGSEGMVAAVTYISLSLLAFIVLLYLTYRAIRGLSRLFTRRTDLYGSDPRSRLIALGLAGLFFPSVVGEFFRVAVALLASLATNIPRSLSQYWQSGSEVCRQAVTEECVVQLAFGFLQGLGSALARAIQESNFRFFPFWQLVLMLALAAILAPIPDPVPDAPTSWSLQRTFAGLTSKKRQDLLLFLLLGVATYLSIAAIAAIPGLEERGSESVELSVEKLERQLVGSPRAIDLKMLEAADPNTELASYLAKGEPPPSETTATAAGRRPAEVGATTAIQPSDEIAFVAKERQRLLAELSTSVDQSRQTRGQLISQIQSLMDEAQQKVDGARATALSTFEISNADRKGARERLQHFRDLVEWFRQVVNVVENRQANCKTALQIYDDSRRAWARSIVVDLTRTQGSSEVFWPDADDSQSLSGLMAGCSSVSGERSERVPERPALGSYLGPFGFVASWLLRTESLPLALIVGLFGFGLLGSAVSTFVRESAAATSLGGRQQRRVEEPLVSDIPGVVIRGLSAAIVVFLAVKGGLAIFSNGEGEANSYVLLLTCLVASVFSEKVWDWAQMRLVEKLGRG